jgi:NAD(P)-dependent dehydrogenase (short-subunit alcohol dehydrogenase family)
MTGTAIVAGAGGGGAATALALAARGWSVAVVDSRLEAAERAAGGVVAVGGDATAHTVDLLDIDAVTALRDAVRRAHGSLDAAIHLVGGWRGTDRLGPQSATDWFALNPPIVGTLAVLTGVVADDLRTSASGRAVMVTATGAAHPTAGNAAYASAKAGAEAWMAAVADDFTGTAARAVTVAVKALLTDAMRAEQPDRRWPGYTHVDELGAAIARICAEDVANGARIDLTDRPA